MVRQDGQRTDAGAPSRDARRQRTALGAWPRSCCIAEKALATAGATIPRPDDLDDGVALTLSIPGLAGQVTLEWRAAPRRRVRPWRWPRLRGDREVVVVLGELRGHSG